MKKRYLSLIIIAATLVLLASIWYYIANHHTIIFDIKTDDTITIDIDTADGKKVAEISSKSETLWLWKGEYTYNATGDKYDTSKKSFTVENADNTIVIQPDYSDSYLYGLLTPSVNKELSKALQSYTSKVPSSAQSTEFALVKRADWAIGHIVYQPDRRDIPETYRFVLKKENNVWKVAIPPQQAIYAQNYPTIPREIIDKLY